MWCTKETFDQMQTGGERIKASLTEVPQPVWQVGHAPWTVWVGVVGQNGFCPGIVTVSSRTHIGRGGHLVRGAQFSAGLVTVDV
jgi:hypothetical protein